MEAVSIKPEDELILPHHRRAFVEYVHAEEGARTLLVHYRELEIEFDEPELFGFAEKLIAQERFVAASAIGWGEGYTWSRVSELLAALIERGVLKHADGNEPPAARSSGPLPSPLPAATCVTPRTWLECEALSAELTGQKVELAHLELLVPLHRVAHSMLDREGRQVGEANVFPPQLRLEVPTEWRSCQYPGSRYQDEYPLNASALRSMQRCWWPLLALMDRTRELYLRRFPSSRTRFTLLDAHLFSCLLMGLPAYAQQRARQPVANGALHPVLSSLARLADGVRMTTNELLTAETLHAPIDASGLHEAAERTNLFLSTYGVCAGSRKAIDTFLDRFTHTVGTAEELDAELEDFSEELDIAIEYGLHAMCSYALGSYAWALVSETFERLGAALSGAQATSLAARIAADRKQIAALGTAALREQHKQLYAGMLEHCAGGLDAELGSGGGWDLGAFLERGPRRAIDHNMHARSRRSVAAPVTTELQATLTAAFSGFASSSELSGIVLDHLRKEQLLAAQGELCQARVSACLGRAPAKLPLTAATIFLGHRLRHPAAQLPYVMDALRDELGLRIAVTSDALTVLSA